MYHVPHVLASQPPITYFNQLNVRYHIFVSRQPQNIVNGFQHEQPDYWLTFGNPWEIERFIVSYPIKFYGHGGCCVLCGLLLCLVSCVLLCLMFWCHDMVHEMRWLYSLRRGLLWMGGASELNLNV